MKPRGFSLMEVFIAMAILTVVMVGTMPLVGLAIRRGAESRRITAAQQLSVELLVSLRSAVRYGGSRASTAGSAECRSAMTTGIPSIESASAKTAWCGDSCASTPGTLTCCGV